LAQQQLYGLIGSSIPARDACILFGCINQQMGNFHTSPAEKIQVFPSKLNLVFCIALDIELDIAQLADFATPRNYTFVV
jgi:hypothetical protein